MDNALVVRSQDRSIPTEHEMMVYHTMAEQAVSSKMYSHNFKEKSGVMMIMLAARELGIPPMQALNGGINIIQGRVEISARMMSALIRKSGHQIKVKECSGSQCILEGRRCDTGETLTSSFSLSEAQLAGLVKPNSGWTKWPKDMCFARALSRLARQLFSDVVGIGYVEGEISAVEIKPEVEAISEEIVVEEVVQENEDDCLNSYLNLFDVTYHKDAMDYLNTVCQHFGWTIIQTIKELMKDEAKLMEKFTKWKSKQRKAE